jgi:L-asparagine oxygenase
VPSELANGRGPGTTWQIAPEFTLTEAERSALEKALGTVTANPYRLYDAHRFQIGRLIAEGAVPERLHAYIRTLAARDRHAEPVVVVKNVPYDRDVPLFDFDEPVKSKYELKKTFVAEGFLALFAQLAGTPAIGYVNVNDGDVFQDIHPKRSLQSTQSQKALDRIYFHKDLANHFVRPDQVYMVGMRSTSENEVYTSFVRNVDVIASFSEAELEILRAAEFHTPFDDLTVMAGSLELGEADRHPVIGGEDDLRYFENRTLGVTDRAKALVPKITETLHALKRRVFIEPGDFVITYNNHTVHAKEVVTVRDPDALRNRWIIKTVNVDDIEQHRQHLMAGTGHLVNG